MPRPASSPLALRDGAPADPAPWLELALATAALVYQTDREGRLTMIGPDGALGWASGPLLGTPGAQLLAAPDDEAADSFDPFRVAAPVQHRRCWLRRGDGGLTCLSVTAVPVLDAAGRISGTRGCGIDFGALDASEPEVAAALRRADVLDRVLRTLRVERLPDHMIQQALRSLAAMLGADGALVVDADAEPPAHVRQAVGAAAEAIAAAACEHLRFTLSLAPASAVVDGHPLVICPCPTRFGGLSGLVLWRGPNRRRFEAGDRAIADSATGLLRLMLEHGYLQAGLAAQARTDGVTGLANRRAFFEEVTRRVDRLDRDRLPGTLMVVSLEQFEALRTRLGADFGDEALRIAAALLRVTFRPGDLIARLRGAAFAVWMDGADEMTAAERAEALCRDGPREFAHLGRDGVAISIAIGIVMRWPDGMADAAELKHRAEFACDQARLTDGAGWRVWHGAD